MDATTQPDATTQLDDLGSEFWQWRAATAFHTSDDIPRLARPAGWLPAFDAAGDWRTSDWARV